MPPSLRRQGGAMLAIDTNVIVRIVTNDSPEQSPRARTLVESEDVFVCTSVLLETEWVLRSGYDFHAGGDRRCLARLHRAASRPFRGRSFSRESSRLDEQRARFRGCPAFGTSGGMYGLHQFRRAVGQSRRPGQRREGMCPIAALIEAPFVGFGVIEARLNGFPHALLTILSCSMVRLGHAGVAVKILNDTASLFAEPRS